jgi:solute carrier family 25 phosphate transporter 3
LSDHRLQDFHFPQHNARKGIRNSSLSSSSHNLFMKENRDDHQYFDELDLTDVPVRICAFDDDDYDDDNSIRSQRIDVTMAHPTTGILDRRQMLLASMAVAAAATLLPSNARATASAATSAASATKSLEDIQLGHGSWTRPTDIINNKENSDKATRKSESIASTRDASRSVVPPSFISYLTRFLINYDDGVSSWWVHNKQSYQLLSEEQQQSKLGRDFGKLAASLQDALQQYLVVDQFSSTQPISPQSRYEQFFDMLTTTYYYGDKSSGISGVSNASRDEIGRQLCLLGAVLPTNLQPKVAINKLIRQQQQQQQKSQSISVTFSLEMLSSDLSLLLPTNAYSCVQSSGDGLSSFYKIEPQIALYQVGLGEGFGQAATATAFGPVASTVLTRERPKYTFDIYALFGISGATGCALTHSLVIPIDVVKTKAQTNPDDEEYSNLVVGAQRILDEEGVPGLLIGAQATLAGYFWYGLSVYPSYAFFKRWLGSSLLPTEVAVAHANDIALVAGALAAVIASLGLTPLESARIRVVADPQRYRPLGLIGTLKVIAEEGQTQPRNGDNSSTLKESLQSLYAGLPSLMTRQVIFGSVKFVAFERACETIYTVAPSLRDAVWTSLLVSLAAGGFSGALSSFVSQPADAVLTYVAASRDAVPDLTGKTTSDKNHSGGGGGMSVLEGCRRIIEESGPSSLFRGLGSRSWWAASIIAGQFLLYDVFRSFFGVNSNDLIQIFQVDM